MVPFVSKTFFAKCKEFGMEAVAITDHGAMHGALEFYLAAKKAKIKPIIGSEFYIAPGGRQEKGNAKSAGAAAFHLVLLARDYNGYKNLMKLASIAQMEGFYYKPRIDKDVLFANNTGLIAMSACLHGEIPHLIGSGDSQGAKKVAEEYRQVFGDRFYFEIQENNIPEQQAVNQGLIALSAETGIPVVATNDCHYLTREQCHAHEVLLCIQTGKTIQDINIPGDFIVVALRRMQGVVIPESKTVLKNKDILMGVVKVSSLQAVREKFHLGEK